jgi:hypothetical protein
VFDVAAKDVEHNPGRRHIEGARPEPRTTDNLSLTGLERDFQSYDRFLAETLSLFGMEFFT